MDVALGADEEEECYHVPHSIPKPLHHKTDSDCSEEITQLFITIYPFEPNQIETESTSNELKLEVGDLIDVLKTNETGWWKGRCLRTEDEGWFPSSYVKVCKNDPFITKVYSTKVGSLFCYHMETMSA